MISEKPALDKLSLRYKQADDANTPDIFFLNLYNCMEVYFTDPISKPIGQLVEKKKEVELALFYKLDKQVKKEMKDAYDPISELIHSYVLEGIKFVSNCDPTLVPKFTLCDSCKLDEQCEQIKVFKEKPVKKEICCEIKEFSTDYVFKILRILDSTKNFEPSANPGLGINDSLCLMIKKMIFNLNFSGIEGVSELMHRFATLDQKGYIREYIFCPSFNAWKVEENKILKIVKTRVWYALQKLRAFYEAHDLELYAKSEEMGLYKSYLGIVYAFLKTEQPPEKHTKLPDFSKGLSYDKSARLLGVGGIVIRIAPGYQDRLLKMFFKGGKPLTKIFHRDDIHDKVVKTEADQKGGMLTTEEIKKQKDQVYNLMPALNNKIEAATGLKNFFLLKKGCGEYRINPQYMPLVQKY